MQAHKPLNSIPGPLEVLTPQARKLFFQLVA